MIRAGRPDFAIDFLREHPECVHARVAGNQTLLMVAACAGQAHLADRLLAMGAKLDFIAAIVLGRTELVRTMLEAEPNLIFRQSTDRWSALHMAARYADPGMVDLLLSAGADANGRTLPHRPTPFFFAFPQPYRKAELLLAKGADINARAKHGFTVLHYAANRGDTGFVDFLLAHGAQRDLQTHGRQTAWSLAVRAGHPQAAKLLF